MTDPTPPSSASSSTPKRRRRTPEQARAVILEAAQTNLIEHGMDGLRIEALAEATGMRHSNIIHHFGSIEAVRRALVVRICDNLLTELKDLVAIADTSGEASVEITHRTFEAFSRPENVVLVAWHVLSNEHGAIEELDEPLLDLSELTKERLKLFGLTAAADRENVAGLINLTIAAAIGEAIAEKVTPPSVRKHLKKHQIRDWIIELTLAKSGLKPMPMNK